eukprot:g13862.t1
MNPWKCSEIIAEGTVPWLPRESLTRIDEFLEVSPYRRDDVRPFLVKHFCEDKDENVRSVAIFHMRYINEQGAINSLLISWTVILIILVGMCTITRDLGHLSRKLLEPLRILADEMQNPTSLEDWAFLLKAGKMEVSKLEALLLLFSLCHVVNWFCNGRAPRLDSDALRLLVKVQEFQVHCALEHRSKTNAAPLVIFVHRELEMPFSPAVPGHQVYDAVEKVLDNRWRNSLKKMKLLQDAKRSSASVLNELCQPDVFGEELYRFCSSCYLGCCLGSQKVVSQLAEASKEKREKLSFEDWLGTASALHLRLHATLTAAARLPEELAQAVGEELYFAFNSAQEAIDEACQSFSAKLGSADSQELLEAAEQQVLQKTYTPLGACAWAVARKHCERLINMQSRPCKARCWSGRSCNLMEGHQDRRVDRATREAHAAVQLFEKFEPPKAAAEGIAPFGPCCHNVNFMPFLPEGCDFDMDPVLIPPSPRLSESLRGERRWGWGEEHRGADGHGEVGSDGRPKEVIMTGGKVVLPAGMLVQLVLPYAYFRADTPVPSFWDLGHDAERCRLLPYLLTLRRPS